MHGTTLPHACRDQQMLEKKAHESQEAASAREADISMERERQRAVLAAQVLRPPRKPNPGYACSRCGLAPEGPAVNR